MQGSYTKDGLPRPYHMKPRKPSVYDTILVKPFFSTPRRKVVGYLILLSLIGTMMYYISQDLRPKILSYSLEDTLEKPTKAKPAMDIGTEKKIAEPQEKGATKHDIPGSIDDEGAAELANADLAKKSMDPKVAVVEAPKGGIANEANVVGNNQDLFKSSPKPAGIHQKDHGVKNTVPREKKNSVIEKNVEKLLANSLDEREDDRVKEAEINVVKNQQYEPKKWPTQADDNSG